MENNDMALPTARATRASHQAPSGLGHSAGIANAGMTPYGPSHPDYPNPPSDWDGGPYLCRDGGLYHMRGYGWEHGLGCWNPEADWDRVAYTTQGGRVSQGEQP